MNWDDLTFWNSSTFQNIQQRLLTIGEGNYLPPKELWFRALEYTPYDKVKVVIVGQDPYHTTDTAHGLAFSSSPTHRVPPSLRNIFNEYVSDLGFPFPRNGYLKPWADEGVLLINSCLTCEPNRPRVHRGFGWETLVHEIIVALSCDKKKPVVFMLWGRDAQQHEEGICLEPEFKNLIIKSSHPSPYSAHQGFLGSRPFSRANEFLVSQGVRPVNWRLP